MGKKKKRSRRSSSNKTKSSSSKKRRKQVLMDCCQWIDQGELLNQSIQEYRLEKSKETSTMDWRELAEQMEKVTQKNKKIKRIIESSGIKSSVSPTQTVETQTNKSKRQWLESFLFYAVIMVVIITLSNFLVGSGEKTPRNLGGYVPMVVLSKSMQRVYPKDSLIISKVTDPKKLKIGDDITFITEHNKTVTHRIVEIDENYLDSGKRGFTTKGVENPSKDDEVVAADNVVGKVVYHNNLLGQILVFIRENMLIAAVILISLIFFIDAVISYFSLSIKNKKKKY